MLPEVEREAVRATALDRALRIRFDWRVRERDARFSGQGVTRVEPPYNARLDLFGPRGEGVLRAAVVDDDLRLPPGMDADLLPPVHLLWSVLGVFRPPEDAEPTTAVREDGRLRLEYARDGERWRFIVEEGRLRSAEWDDAAGRRHTVELNGVGAHGVPERVEYRDYAAFRELVLTLDQVDEVEAFPSDIWTPDAAR